MHPPFTPTLNREAQPVGKRCPGEGLCTFAGAGEGLPREGGEERERERGQWGGGKRPFLQSPFWALGAADSRWVGAPEGWGRKKQVACGEAGRTHLAPGGMKS